MTHDGSTTTMISLDSNDPRNVIALQKAAVNCSELFTKRVDGTTTVYKLLHLKSLLLRLNALDTLRDPNIPFDFLPKKIIVRECMQDMFNKIVHGTTEEQYSIVFGSPGVGKSVLTFLASLCYVRYVNKPVLYLRKTTKKNEAISVFWIEYIAGSGDSVQVTFDRNVLNVERNTNTLRWITRKLFNDYIFKADVQKMRFFDQYLRLICDGPCYDDKDNFVKRADLVTSGGYKEPKDEARTELNPLPLSAWTEKEVVLACRVLFGRRKIEAKDYFDVCGGNIRMITEIGSGEATLETCRAKMIRLVEKEGNPTNLQIAYESTQLSGDGASIDRFRTMFAKEDEGIPGIYDTVQYIGSPLLLRLIRSKVSLESILSGLRFAKDSGIQSLYGWHFELLAHRLFQETHRQYVAAQPAENHQHIPAIYPFDIVGGGGGSGKESVKKLTGPNQYWTPSTSNFGNIDAAIGIESVLYCIQYTVSNAHSFNIKTFFSSFWNELSSEYRRNIEKVIVLFVVPRGMEFGKVKIPENQQYLLNHHGCTADNLSIQFVGRGRLQTEDSNGDEDEDDDDSINDAGYDSDSDDEYGDGNDDMILDEAGNGRETEGIAITFEWEAMDEEYHDDAPPLSFLALNTAED
mmetsp:Transcript_25058/g.59553  ORF Transcript_25058/g.59553 Transcript_25058/m.59553 type:complete len:632 (-) Transcript_25058:167-2062(-)|eukprot:CAMPEP_0113464242 /NCGR_PEP_ID=MMETSP0014_2-20120614/13097_1 /TAXON_ID=2857 /ORGANISM="Nitzschia sp." /LENGTH=631 /DNA_ID=CAMNT_0000356311 /DNA_START=108 /DNA_END=2003 /DNA_ORIENTATION=+ /assembly_acc=CAM_ASM_000159